MYILKNLIYMISCWIKNTITAVFFSSIFWNFFQVSANIIWLNKANQGLESEHEAILSRMYQFYNINASSIRTLLVANCPKDDDSNESSHKPAKEVNHIIISSSSSNSSNKW